MSNMQKYWLPFRKLESLGDNTNTLTLATERTNFQSNNKWSSLESSSNYKKIVRSDIPQSLARPKNVIESTTGTTGTTVAENKNNWQGFVSGFELHNNKERKRPSTESVEEPTRKKVQANNEIKIKEGNTKKLSLTKSESIKKDDRTQLTKQQRCLTGDVAQILNFNKKFPNTNNFYEVYAKVIKVDSSKELKKTILLRQQTGPILQCIFYEIDVKMVDVKPGDDVRCIGKFVNNSYLHLFKVSILNSQLHNKQLVSRLYSVANFVLNHSETSKKSKAPQ